jgi:hypothetical protein
MKRAGHLLALVLTLVLYFLSLCRAADLVLLGDYEGAVCIDGSPGGFYFVPGDAGICLFSPLFLLSCGSMEAIYVAFYLSSFIK